MTTSDDLSQEFLSRVLPILYYSATSLDFYFTDQHFSKKQLEDIKYRFNRKNPKLTFTHFAILSWLRLKKLNGHKISHIELFEKIKRVVAGKNTSEKYNKYQRKTSDLRAIGFVKEKKEIRKPLLLAITQSGLDALSEAEKERKHFLSQLIESVGLEDIQKILLPSEESVKKFDQDMLKKNSNNPT